MSDFVHEAWSLYIAIITIAGVSGCVMLLRSMSTRRADAQEKIDTTGHTWDDDLSEWNNPLPRWWMWLFYITIVFGVGYLVLYPGLGAYQGFLGWSSNAQYQSEQKQAERSYRPIFQQYAKLDIPTVAADAAARQIGQRLFLNQCAGCHGSDAGGSRGFPSLRDNDWLYGSDPEIIRTSIAEGRAGVMPPMGEALGGSENVRDVAHHVLRLAGRTSDDLRAQRGKAKFAQLCAVCHGIAGKGNPAIGAPNLTDGIWLYGSSEAVIIETITKGRNGSMPAHKDVLDADRIHLLAAYVYSLTAPQSPSKK